MAEIVLPETEPETEWILGRPVQKVSPERPHALLQRELASRLDAWARGRGEVGTEWRFRLAPPGEIIRPLVPDIAYLSYDRMGDATDDELRAPRVAPDVAVEIRSPDDRQLFIDHKVDVYLASGTSAVILIDPQTRRIETRVPDVVTRYVEGDMFEHPALPGFTFAVNDLFDVLRRPR